MSEEEVDMPEGWKDYNIQEAREELDDEQLRVWDDHRSEKLREQGRENIKDLQKEESKAVDALIQEADETMTSEVKIQDHLFEVDLSLLQDKQVALRRKFEKIDDLDEEDIDEEILEDIKENLIEALDELVVNTSKKVWQKFAEERNVSSLNIIGGKILLKAQEELQEKMGSVEKFR